MGRCGTPLQLIPTWYVLLMAIGFGLVHSFLGAIADSVITGNLKRNFEARYSGCSLLDFERTSLEQRPLGREYFYNIPIMDKSLHYDAAWGRRDGFGAEVATANVNLSLVDSQIVSFIRSLDLKDSEAQTFNVRTN